MTNREREQLLNKMKRTARAITGNSAVAQKVLHQTGVYTPSGKLKKTFRQ